MKILFVTYGPLEWASSRIRCFWPAKYLDAHVTDFGQYDQNPGIDDAYDVYIFQKHGRPGRQKGLMESGKLVFWDACDPAWWFSPDEVKQVTDNCQAVVCSNEALAQDFREWNPETRCETIPDRLELAHYPIKREHKDVSPVRLIWFGIRVNRIALPGAWANLVRLAANGYNIELTIFDERPDLPLGLGNEIPVTYIEWTLVRENEVIARHDIALLPPYPGPWGAVKSDNKTLTAWACGLPVIDGLDYEEMRSLVYFDDDRRNFLPILEHDGSFPNHYNVQQSAQEWQELIADVRREI